jgi:hypothetical protein
MTGLPSCPWALGAAQRRPRSSVRTTSQPAFSALRRQGLAARAARDYSDPIDLEIIMTHTPFRNFAATLDDLARDIVHATRRGARAIAAMSWPSMILCCIGIAFVISLLPLALFLFIAFMGVKLIAGAFILDGARSRRDRNGH